MFDPTGLGIIAGMNAGGYYGARRADWQVLSELLERDDKAPYDAGSELWTSVIGHSVIRLTVVFVAGGADRAILRSGRLRRRGALMLTARRAVLLIIACVPLPVLAGAIEGFISSADMFAGRIRWVVSVGSGLFLYAYLLRGGHGPEARTTEKERL